MRTLYALLLALILPCITSAQASNAQLADSIDTARTIIAKLDHATQNDPPPNFGASIIVNTHHQATSFISFADDVAASVRKGQAPEGTSMFLLYSQFIDLFDMYEFFTSAESRPLELDKVRSVALSKEYATAKTDLQTGVESEIFRMEQELKACPSSKAR